MRGREGTVDSDVMIGIADVMRWRRRISSLPNEAQLDVLAMVVDYADVQGASPGRVSSASSSSTVASAYTWQPP